MNEPQAVHNFYEPAGHMGVHVKLCQGCLLHWDGEGETPPGPCPNTANLDRLRELQERIRTEAAESPLVKADRKMLENEVKIQSQRAEGAEKRLEAMTERADRAQSDARGQKARADAVEDALDAIIEAAAKAKAHSISAQAAAIAPPPNEKVERHSSIGRVGEGGDYPVMSR